MVIFFFFNDTATTEIYTLSLHDALPISRGRPGTDDGRPDAGAARGARRPHEPGHERHGTGQRDGAPAGRPPPGPARRSEEHTSELQSRQYLVCRLLLEKQSRYQTAASPP